VPGSAADKAGMKKGDVIIAVAGAVAQSSQDVVTAIRQTKVGEHVIVTVDRAGKKIDLDAVLGEAPAQ
jgi:S1-C subfamily serine protease